MVDEALRGMSEHFDTLYARGGRRSIAPEKLVRTLLLQALNSVRSERQLMEQMENNLLFRWFVGLNMDDAIRDMTVFPRNRERLIVGEVLDEEFVQGLRARKAVPHVGRVRTQPQVAELPDRRRTPQSELLREP
jgi:transposase